MSDSVRLSPAFFAALLASIVATPTSLVDAGETEPFPLELAFSQRTTFSDNERAQVSADGRYLAYVVVTPEKKPEDVFTLSSGLPVFLIGTQVHVTDVGSGKSTPLGAEGTNSFSPIGSPDGKTSRQANGRRSAASPRRSTSTACRATGRCSSRRARATVVRPTTAASGPLSRRAIG